ncbi:MULTISPECIES: hypothetical protein [Bacillus cereus group]|uniref:hypothetical protein n=1 Tax=Bacillus cereus group TaxID=86661 RepID=UPI00016B6A02|nr:MULTISPECIES: hypothetical protein [Bacillus cereus group]EDZ48794.1 hypothetical protein BCAH1134_C0011 [Bacillus cereus AH1134]EKS8379147.1 hypothetical protein [Bacillus cereus]EKS8383781.1 hypothetical protein [Bacillus cereus]EMA7399815.1 hypothetical protein [Bacillus cereus]MDA2463762.1 hypothetical protein [Bacillus cereus]
MSDKHKELQYSLEDIDLKKIKSIKLDLDELKKRPPGFFEFLEQSDGNKDKE